MTRLLCLLYFVLILLLSCDNSLLPIVNRSIDDPSDNIVYIDSFSTENEIHISWEEDAAADEYILMRTLDNKLQHFVEVYRGKNLSYTDSDVVSRNQYIYRLDKIRGTRLFTSSQTALGVCPILIQDELEPNNTMTTSTFLSYAHQANIFRYEFVDGRVLEDTDYYSIRVSPRSVANIVITEANKSADEQTSFQVCQDESQAIIYPKSQTAFQIENTDIYEKIVVFKVYADPDILKASTIAYTIQLTTISPR